MSGSTAAAAGGRAGSAWAPLREPVFRSLWIAQFGANVGTWAQTVGAQWLMGDLGGGALAVSLVQTAATMPVFLLVLPAGALGDVLDRRRLLIASQAIMFLASASLAVLTVAGVTTVGLLLALAALMGTGTALAMPTFAAIQPELVAREELPSAALLNGANLNVARALGPALGGLLIGAAGPEATFALNALAVVGVVSALVAWERPPDDRPLGSEPIADAIVAGARYVRSTPAFATILARTLMFVVFASALWALLPVVARGPLDLEAGGYGVLLAAVGAGAVAGAFAIPALRARLGTNGLVGAASVAYGAGLLVVGAVDALAPVVAALALCGFAWIATMSSLSAGAQVILPNWARARALAFTNLIFMGGLAFGSVLWGAVAEGWSLRTAFAVAAAGLVAGPLAGSRRLPLGAVGDVRPARHWPEPNVEWEVDPSDGPVLVIVEWPIPPESADAFLAAMVPVRRARRRTGATMWGIFRDLEQPDLFVETFVVDSWHEHLRQHLERHTVADEEADRAAVRFLAEGDVPRIRHLVWAERRERRLRRPGR
ncbi:MAG TPA: MFS transporter [Capillimicrobium sp.]|nr:MFS transporter [Capillimicrobium sp.]